MISYRGEQFKSIRDISGIPQTHKKRGMESYRKVAARPDTDIVQFQFGDLTFLAYVGAVMPPTMTAHRIAHDLGQVVVPIINEVSIRENREFTIVDIGTGSGLIAITLAHNLSKQGVDDSLYRIVANDISGTALEVASLNAVINNTSNIRFRRGDLVSGIVQEFGRVDVIVSNPPFYRDTERGNQNNHVVPDEALYAGTDPLSFYTRLFVEGMDILNSTGVMVLQVPEYIADQTLIRANYCLPRVRKDFIHGEKGNRRALLVGNIDLFH